MGAVAPARMVRSPGQSLEFADQVRNSTTSAFVLRAWRAGPPDATVALACGDALSRTRQLELAWAMGSGGGLLLAEHVCTALEVLRDRPDRHTQLHLPAWAHGPILRAPVSCRAVLGSLVKTGWYVPLQLQLPGGTIKVQLAGLRKELIGRPVRPGAVPRRSSPPRPETVTGSVARLLRIVDLQPEVLAAIAEWLSRVETDATRAAVREAAGTAALQVAAYRPTANLPAEPGSAGEREEILVETAGEERRRASLLRAGSSEDASELEQLFALTEPFTVRSDAPHLRIGGGLYPMSVLYDGEPADLHEQMPGVVAARSLLRNPALPKGLRDKLVRQPLARLLDGVA